MAWAVDDGPVQLWKPGDPQPIWSSPTNNYFDRGCVQVGHTGASFEAHNAFFERSIWANIIVPQYGWGGSIEWSCSAAKCAAHSLPRALDKAGAALGLSVQKDQEGKRIMMKLCKPRKPTKNNSAEWHEGPEDYEKLYAYCMDDVRAERALSNALKDLNKIETKVWQLDQIINERGIRVDIEAVEAVLNIRDDYIEGLNLEVSDLTGGKVSKLSETGKLKTWLQDNGLNIDSVAKDSIEQALTMDITDTSRRVLELRQLAAKTSVAKYKAVKDCVAKDGRMRGLFMYHGSHTGRWTGKVFQSQNLPKRTPESQGGHNMEQYFSILKLNNASAFELCYPDVLDTVSQMIRPIVIPSEGKTFFGGDYASIEARVLLWLADDEASLDIYRQGGDMYKELASEIYKIPVESIEKESKERQVGKQGILGLGFQMAAERFQETCAKYKIHIELELAEKVKNAYRNRFKKVVNLWYDQEAAAKQAVITGKFVRCGKIGWGMHGGFLFCKLPSGRVNAYYDPKIKRIEIKPGWIKDTLTYWGINSDTKKWEEKRTYGGSLTENFTQGVARDLMAEAMLRVEDAGYEIIMHTHDEITSENEEGSIEEFEKLMSHVPEWGAGIPIEVEGWSGSRYLK